MIADSREQKPQTGVRDHTGAGPGPAEHVGVLTLAAQAGEPGTPPTGGGQPGGLGSHPRRCGRRRLLRAGHERIELHSLFTIYS